jgi:hypothetical protein
MSEACHLVKANTTSNTFLGESFVEMLNELITDKSLLAQELEAEWLDLSACPVFEEDFIKLLSSPLPRVGSAIVVGVDVATGGDNSSACVKKGNELIKIHSQRTSSDVGTLVNMVHNALGGLAPDYFVIDSTGVGAFAPTEFKRHWPDAVVIPVNFAEESLRPGYTNRRAELCFELRRKITEGLRYGAGIPQETRDLVHKQAMATEYMIGPKNRLALVPKKDIKQKIGCSPDELDAIMLASFVDADNLARLNKSTAPIPTMPLSVRKN